MKLLQKMKADRKFYLFISTLLLLVILVGCNNTSDVNHNLENQDAGQIGASSGENSNIRQISANSGEDQDELKDNIKHIDGIKKIGDIEISNIQIKLIDRNKCEFTADVKNTSKEYIKPTNVEIRAIYTDKDKEDVVFGGIITELAGYESESFTTFVLKDITGAHDIEISAIDS